MGIKKNAVTQEFEVWSPDYLPKSSYRVGPVFYEGLVVYPFGWFDRLRDSFTHANWVALRAHMTIYMVLLLTIFFTIPAWALTGAELDSLVPTIIAAESSGLEGAVGSSGERGLMQIKKTKWLELSGYSWHDAFDGQKNMMVGRHILELINERYLKHGVEADAKHVVYSYNTGHFAFHKNLPKWTKRHANRIYREIFNEK